MDLLRCPFCANQAIGPEEADWYDGPLYVVSCLVCGAMGGAHEDPDEAVRYWNARAIKPARLIQCQECGKEILSFRSHQKLCSNRCRQRAFQARRRASEGQN